MIRYRVAAGNNPFDLAVAIETATESSGGMTGETFVLVANGRPFLGFQRRALPAKFANRGALESVGVETARVMEKMVKAAIRHGRAPAGSDLETVSFLSAPSDEPLVKVWDTGIFEPHLRWIADNTASPALRKAIFDIAEQKKGARNDSQNA